MQNQINKNNEIVQSLQNLNCQLIEERKGLNEQNAQDSLMIKDLLDRIKQKDEEINNLQDQVMEPTAISKTVEIKVQKGSICVF